MSVFDSVIGQQQAVTALRRAAQDAAVDPPGAAMTHAWLLTGPPGSGRSVLGLAFAAALVCPSGGCGSCIDCRNVASGTHPDVEHVVPEGVIYGVDEADLLIERAAMAPRRARWHIIVVEDVDRFQLNAVPKLLRTIEEPPPRTVWVLCSPTAEDVLPTVRSRCRHVVLNTPRIDQIADQLASSVGVPAEVAIFAATVSQGHIGRARALAIDESVRQRRREVLNIPSSLATVGACFAAAAAIVDTATRDADAVVAPLDQADDEAVRLTFGEGAEGLKSVDRTIKRELKVLEKRIKARHRRTLFDQFDRVLLDLMGYYRDVLVVQLGSGVELINSDVADSIRRTASADDATGTLRRVAAIREARDQLQANVYPQTVFESLFVALRDSTLVANR
jgi:DNA polymerase-3 subunit delta'